MLSSPGTCCAWLEGNLGMLNAVSDLLLLSFTPIFRRSASTACIPKCTADSDKSRLSTLIWL
jgi:hypothetical protein